MNGTILVSGATGKTGRELIRQLSARGATVRAGVHNPAKAAALELGRGVEIAALDFSRPETFEPALADVAAVYLLPVTGPAAPEAALPPFVDCARAAGVRHIAFLTALGVASDEDNPLRKVEKYIEASGVPYTLLRPSWFMQNFSEGFIGPMIKGLGGIFLPAGDGRTGFIDARDIAAVAAAVLTEPGHAGRAYGLTGGEALTYAETAAIISRTAGREVKYVPISDAQMRESLAGQGWQPGGIQMFSNLFASVRDGSAATVTPDVAQVLGRPPITFAQFAQDHAATWG